MAMRRTAKTLEQLREERNDWEAKYRKWPSSPYIKDQLLKANRALEKKLYGDLKKVVTANKNSNPCLF